MVSYKIFLGSLSIIIAIISYIPYFRNIFRGRTKPHAISWFVWGVLTTIAFVAQVVEKGGAGAWVTGFTAIVCFTIAALAFIKGERQFVLFDWLSLLAAMASLILWWLTKEPLTAVILITITDAFGFLPTFRKGYHKPDEETAITFALSGVKFLISIFALETLTLATWLFPLSLVITNGLFVVLLVVRRVQLRPEDKIPHKD